ncbi:MAG: hypothetical protein NVSMB47_19120 [Polyangiales bacterium]
MVGNLDEWIDDTAMRGGFYLDVTSLGAGCGYPTRAHSRVYADDSTGFQPAKTRRPALVRERDAVQRESGFYSASAGFGSASWSCECSLTASPTAWTAAERMLTSIRIR